MCHWSPNVIGNNFGIGPQIGLSKREILAPFKFSVNMQHPTYKGLLELGKVRRTIFLCDYLRLESLRREIQEGQSARGELELGHQFYSLRSSRRILDEQARRSRAGDACTSLAPNLISLYPDLDDSRCIRRTSMDEHDDERGSAGAHSSDLQ
jgi:hypothetical protein